MFVLATFFIFYASAGYVHNNIFTTLHRSLYHCLSRCILCQYRLVRRAAGRESPLHSCSCGGIR